MRESLFIVMPAYNEEANIINTLNDWYGVVESIDSPDSRLVVMDDGSKDSTYSLLKEYSESHPLLIPLTHENAGHGATLLDLYKFALDSDADYIFQTDTDGQTDPGQFAGFWHDRHDYDMIIGWRKNREDGLSRVVVTRVLRRVVRRTFHVRVIDANAPFRLMSADSLRENIELIPDGFNLSNVVLSAIYAKKGQAVDYREITFRPRQGGVNSINLPRIVGIGKNALGDFRSINNKLDAALAKEAR